jgi:hypothetical protein
MMILFNSLINQKKRAIRLNLKHSKNLPRLISKTVNKEYLKLHVLFSILKVV